MFPLGVSTTRALSLVVSGSEQVARPWFSEDGAKPKISLADPRIAHYSLEQRKEIVKEVNGQPDAMIAESTAIACRVAPSFIRGTQLYWHPPTALPSCLHCTALQYTHLNCPGLLCQSDTWSCFLAATEPP